MCRHFPQHFLLSYVNKTSHRRHDHRVVYSKWQNQKADAVMCYNALHVPSIEKKYCTLSV